MAQCDIAGTVCAAAAAAASDGCIDAQASGLVGVFSAQGTISICYSYAQAASATHVCDIPGGYEIRSGSVRRDDAKGSYYADWNFHDEILTCQSHMDSTWITTSSDDCVKADASGEAGNAAFKAAADADATSADCGGDIVQELQSGPSSSDGHPDLQDDSNPPEEYDGRAQAELVELDGQAQNKILKSIKTDSVDALKDAVNESAINENAQQVGLKLVQSLWEMRDYERLIVTLYDVPG